MTDSHGKFTAQDVADHVYGKQETGAGSTGETTGRTAGPIYTHRDVVLAQREAVRHVLCVHSGYPVGMARDVARSFYPLPPVERPRVVTLKEGAIRYRVVNGTLQVGGVGDNWHDSLRDADLLANPFETVPDEEGDNV